jgi:tetratricopeptide (TPR) repeat protein
MVPLRPPRANVFTQVANRFVEVRYWPPAAHLYAAAVRLQPRDPRHLILLAKANFQVAGQEQGDPVRLRQALDAALLAAEEAVNRTPWDPRVRSELGMLETDYGLRGPDPGLAPVYFRRADRTFEQAATFGPDIPFVWVTWARSLLLRSDPEEAVEKLLRASELEPGMAVIYPLLGEAYLALGDWERAREAYGQAVQQDPRSAGSWRGLGTANAQLDSWEASANAYLNAVELGAADFLTYRNLALMLGELGQTSRAISFAEKALEVAPLSMEPEVRRLLEELRRMEGSVK